MIGQSNSCVHWGWYYWQEEKYYDQSKLKIFIKLIGSDGSGTTSLIDVIHGMAQTRLSQKYMDLGKFNYFLLHFGEKT